MQSTGVGTDPIRDCAIDFSLSYKFPSMTVQHASQSPGLHAHICSFDRDQCELEDRHTRADQPINTCPGGVFQLPVLTPSTQHFHVTRTLGTPHIWNLFTCTYLSFGL